MSDTVTGDDATPLVGSAAKRLLRLAVSAAILAGLAAKTDWGHMTAAVRGLRWGDAAAAFGVLIAAQVVSALRWRWLARPLGFGGPLRRYVGFYFVGMFFNLLLPTSVGGDAVRAVYLNAGAGRPVVGSTAPGESLAGLEVGLRIKLTPFFSGSRLSASSFSLWRSWLSGKPSELIESSRTFSSFWAMVFRPREVSPACAVGTGLFSTAPATSSRSFPASSRSVPVEK